MLPGKPKLKTSGFRNADIATKTAAKPTQTVKSYDKLWHSSHRYF